MELVDLICGVIFLGTPHQGTRLPRLYAILAWATSLMGSSSTLLWSLEEHDSQLSSLQDKFRVIQCPDIKRPAIFEVKAFYETKPSYLFNFGRFGPFWSLGHVGQYIIL